MTNTWALVPLKDVAKAKGRLAPLLNAANRRALVLALAEDVLSVLMQINGIKRILLVSNEPEAGSLLRIVEGSAGRTDHGSKPLDVFYSSDREGLNKELEQAVAYAAAQGAERVLILHADLPWLSAEAVEKFIARCPMDSVCVAQDKVGTGTNAMLAPLPLPIPLVFGIESLPKFRAEAAARDVDLQVVNDPALSQDIDRPEDFTRLLDEQAKGDRPGPSTRRYLLQQAEIRAERSG